MLTKQQAEELQDIIQQGKDAQELMQNSHRGWTNLSAEEIKSKCDAAQKALRDFIAKSYQENAEMSNDSFTLKPTTQTYELSLADIAQLLSRELGVPAARISIVGTNGLTVTVKGDK